MASATNASSAKNYKALASYINTKELPWFEWFPGHYLKLCKLNPITGQIITFIRSVTGVSLGVHFHPGTVVVYTIQGAWTYDEGWVAEARDDVFEVAGSTHCPRMCGKEETIVLAIIEGALEFRDAQGKVTFVENWQTILKRYQDFCAKEGIAVVDITSFESSAH
jgi:2,4'-dihydroxyacetophenone dioxygenase